MFLNLAVPKIKYYDWGSRFDNFIIINGYKFLMDGYRNERFYKGRCIVYSKKIQDGIK